MKPKRLALLLPLLSACATSTLTPQQCGAGDWQAYGRVDGERGRTADYLKLHQEACGETNAVAWEQGRQEGLRSYCTPDVAFKAGSLGEAYRGVCAGPAASEFERRYQMGLEIHRLRERRHLLQEDLKRHEERFTTSGLGVISDALGFSESSRMRAEISRLDREIAEKETFAGPVESDYGDLSTGTAVDLTGFYLGAFLGFGVGHGIQGRYLSKGWVFTATEVASIAAIVVGSRCEGACRGWLIGGGFAAFIGFKVWEGLDLFRVSVGRLQGYPHLSVLPDAAGLPAPALAWSLRY